MQGHGRLEGGQGARRGRLFAAATGLDTALGGVEIQMLGAAADTLSLCSFFHLKCGSQSQFPLPAGVWAGFLEAGHSSHSFICGQ